jgi:integrase
MLLLMLDAGLRRSELAKLRPKDIRDIARAASPKPRRIIKESTQSWVKVQGKGGKEREVPMTAPTVERVGNESTTHHLTSGLPYDQCNGLDSSLSFCTARTVT